MAKPVTLETPNAPALYRLALREGGRELSVAEAVRAAAAGADPKELTGRIEEDQDTQKGR